MAEYLADTSVFSRLTKPAVAVAFAPLAASGRVAVCAPVIFTLGFSARSHRDHRSIIDGLAAFDVAPVTDADHRQALAIQEALSARGQHRALSLVDALVGAVAAARGLTILHYDHDFERVARVVGAQHRWIVRRGSVD